MDFEEYYSSVRMYETKMSTALQFKNWSVSWLLVGILVPLAAGHTELSGSTTIGLLLLMLTIWIVYTIYPDGKYHEHNYKLKKGI